MRLGQADAVDVCEERKQLPSLMSVAGSPGPSVPTTSPRPRHRSTMPEGPWELSPLDALARLRDDFDQPPFIANLSIAGESWRISGAQRLVTRDCSQIPQVLRSKRCSVVRFRFSSD